LREGLCVHLCLCVSVRVYVTSVVRSTCTRVALPQSDAFLAVQRVPGVQPVVALYIMTDAAIAGRAMRCEAEQGMLVACLHPR
jgi:hypothetical protein